MKLTCSTKLDKHSDVETKTTIMVTGVPENIDPILLHHAGKNMVVFWQDKFRRAKTKDDYDRTKWEGEIELPLSWFKATERGEKTVSKAKAKLAESYGMTIAELEALLDAKANNTPNMA